MPPKTVSTVARLRIIGQMKQLLRNVSLVLLIVSLALGLPMVSARVVSLASITRLTLLNAFQSAQPTIIIHHFLLLNSVLNVMITVQSALAH